ncbi:hypothetical protein DPMN_013154 [Dreissena polymorpha]|uniref:EF-hand domain-containing protein n=1 Tax=Dreissena polymorpha TaxID=45954 RepID=A0A9D4N7D6_DREPO|nr:hypothetical protein DPMN_013154 [Dreissena polymorpha]
MTMITFQRHFFDHTMEVTFFTPKLDGNQCSFKLYDLNRDDRITKDELFAVFGDNKKTT